MDKNVFVNIVISMDINMITETDMGRERNTDKYKLLDTCTDTGTIKILHTLIYIAESSCSQNFIDFPEYGGRWKMLHYYVKKFFDPVLVSMYVENEKVHIYRHFSSFISSKSNF